MNHAGRTGISLIALGFFSVVFSTLWEKQNPLPLQYVLTPAHFSDYFAFHSTDSLHAFAFQWSSYFLTTADGGETWNARTISGANGSAPIAGLFLEAKVIGKDKIIAVGNIPWKTARNGAIFKTADGGTTWSVIPLPVTNEDPDKACIIEKASIVDSLRYFLYTFNYSLMTWKETRFFFRTLDGGNTWSKDSLHFQRLDNGNGIVDVLFLDSLTGWIIERSGYRSTVDGGKTWQTRLLAGYSLNQAYFINKQKGWLIGNSALQTTDGGKTWRQRFMDLPGKLLIKFTDSSNGWLLLSDNRILHTRDGGNKWAFQYTVKGFGSQILDFAFLYPEYGWACGTGGLILHTTSAPSPFIDSQYAFRDSTYTLRFPGYFDTLDYLYDLHYGPKDMSISKGGTITWRPTEGIYYMQRVELITTDKSARKDSITFYIHVNDNLKPFTGITPGGAGRPPSSSLITVTWENKRTGVRFFLPKPATSITITDLRGTAVATGETAAVTENGCEFRWNLRTHSGTRIGAGVYILRADCQGKPLVRQFVVSR